MFDRDHSGTINFQEFTRLWRHVTEWLNSFRHFDRDNSGTIERHELRQALYNLGYRVGEHCVGTLMRRFDQDGSGRAIEFDEYVQLCVQMEGMTASFRRHDTNGDGRVQISYEQFLEMVLQGSVF